MEGFLFLFCYFFNIYIYIFMCMFELECEGYKGLRRMTERYCCVSFMSTVDVHLPVPPSSGEGMSGAIARDHIGCDRPFNVNAGE